MQCTYIHTQKCIDINWTPLILFLSLVRIHLLTHSEINSTHGKYSDIINYENQISQLPTCLLTNLSLPPYLYLDLSLSLSSLSSLCTMRFRGSIACIKPTVSKARPLDNLDHLSIILIMWQRAGPAIIRGCGDNWPRDLIVLYTLVKPTDLCISMTTLYRIVQTSF